MAKPNLRIADAATRSPERQALAEAIERHASATSRAARLNAAIVRSDDLLYGDNGPLRAVELAEQRLGEARTSESRHLASVALGEATEDVDPVESARSALADAQARLASARKTKHALVEEVAAVTTESDSTKKEIDKRIRAVLKSEAAPVIEATLREASTLREQLGAKLLLLRFLRDACFDAWSGLEHRAPIDRAVASPEVEPFGGFQNHPATESWLRAQEALAADADALLPA